MHNLENVEIAARTEAAGAFLDSLALFAWPYIYDTDFDRVRDNIGTFSGALPVVERHRLGAAAWRRIIDRITPDFDRVENDLLAFAERLRERLDRIVADTEFDTAEVAFIRDWQLYMRTDSEAAARRISAAVGRVASGHIAALFTASADADVKTQQQAVSAAAKIVKRFTGRVANRLSVDEAKAARESNPELYSEYLAARRVVNDITRRAIVAETRRNGGPIAMNDLVVALRRAGIEHSLPAGFQGKVDERGYYTMFDEPIDGTPIGEVRMNPAYRAGSSVYVFQTRAPGAKVWQTIYTKAAKSARREEKYSRVSDSAADIARYQRVWRADLMGRDEDRQELGLLAEVLYQTASRIGSARNETDGKKTYGLTTLLGKHVTVRGNSVRIRYVGKKGAQIDYLITATDRFTRRVVELLGKWAAAAGPDGEIFANTAKDVNQYLKNRVKLPISAHGFRYMRGTALMTELLDAARKRLGAKPDAKAVLEAFNAAAEQVGEVLGHTNKKADGTTKVTGATAIKSYIDPSVSREFFARFGVRPPKVLENL